MHAELDLRDDTLRDRGRNPPAVGLRPHMAGRGYQRGVWKKAAVSGAQAVCDNK